VYAEGRLKSDTWVGNDGQNRFTNEINAFTVLFLDSGGERSGPRDSFGGGEPFSTGGPPPADDDDLPW
jgi:single-stranded DNA-binding protein